MKFTCNQVEILNAVSLANRFISSSPSHPILNNLLIDANADTQHLTISSFDLTNAIHVSFKVNNLDDSLRFCIPGRLFQDIIDGVSGELNFKLADSDFELSVNPVGKKNVYKLRGVSAEEYPEIPSAEKYDIEVNAHEFRKGIKCTNFACSTDPTKQILNGTRITFNEYNIDFAATNGSILSKYVLESEFSIYIKNSSIVANDGWGLESVSLVTASSVDKDSKIAVIPSKSLAELDRIISKTTGETALFIAIDGNHIQFKLDNYTLITRAIAGTFPQVESIIPPEFKQHLYVDRKELINSIGNIVRIGGDTACLTFAVDSDNNEISIECYREEITSGKEYLSADIDGDPISLLLFGKYLLAGLKEMSCDKVRLNINESLTPITFSCDDNMTFLVMPMKPST